MLIDDWNDNGPPQTASDAAERALICIFLIDPGARLEVDGTLSVTHFRQKLLGKLYAAAMGQKKCDLIALAHRMESDGVPPPNSGGWPAALSRLTDESWQWDGESVKDYSRIIREAASLRALDDVRRRRTA